ncbi:Dynein_heavy_chain_-_N-terminal_region_2_-_putative [Leishmania major strain Friedlin]|nr:Dynein_heavy_chain_-_N-terminal_region_2_-_putative [Leishmania major strain Friedlin]
MESSKSHEKVGGRLEKVLRCYWDGVPVPLMCNEGKQRSQTFVCRRLAFAPDYHGETMELPLLQTQKSQLFRALCEYVDSPQSVSCRIGSHYSPHVGLFRFDEGKRLHGASSQDSESVVRVPKECCEKSDEGTNAVSMLHRRIRTVKMVSLYKPLIKEYSPLSRHSLRNILILASRGCTSISKEVVAREICDVNEAYAEAVSEGIFYYMCLNHLFRRILAPLQLATEPEPIIRSITYAAAQEAPLSREHFKAAKEQLKSQLLWNPLTGNYFRGLMSIWEEKFARLQFFSIDVTVACIDVVAFLKQVCKAMSSAVSRIRVEFYGCVEALFFSYFKTAREVLLLTEREYEGSVFKKVFVATEVFLVNRIRSLFFDALDSLVRFFDCDGLTNEVRISPRARRLPSLRVELVVGESFQPRAPSFSLLLFGIADFFAEVEKSINGLPRLACAIFREPRLGDKKLTIVSHVEMASYRASITGVLEGASVLINKILSSYSKFCKIPVHNLAIAKTGTPAEVEELVVLARRNLTDIRHVSHDVLFYGRLEISCRPLRLELTQKWENYLSAFVSAFQNTIVSIVDEAKAKSRAILDMLQATPSTVQELEQHLRNTEAAIALADYLCDTSHKQIADRVSCIENLFIPVNEHACRSVLEFKKLPGELRGQADKSGDIRAKCTPLLRRKLENVRRTIRDYYRTLSTGVKGLYHMFDLDTCDIAAQTCAELRKLVERIEKMQKNIKHEMMVLGLPSEDSFDDYLPLMTHFETIEQFWITVFESTKLRELYRTPVSSVNASGFVERAREWRRLIHSSIRNLRAYPALVHLGREQELALAKFEELELFLELITTPGLRKSHWRDIAKLISVQLRDDVMLVTNMTVTVKRLLDAGLLDHIVPLAQIVSQARCDYEVENELEEMRSYAKRTHLVLENTAAKNDLSALLLQEPQREMMYRIEEYVLKCRAMRRRPNLGPSVLKSLDEWVDACEKSRGVLLAWDQVKGRWVNLRACLSSLRSAVAEGICSAEEARLITKSLTMASDAFKELCAILRKPQFSLYTAMMQDTIQDFLLTIKSEVDDAAELLRGMTERRRALFPRFRFLPDSELMGFQSVQSAHSFAHIFQYLYPGITDVEVIDGVATAVVAADGARLPLSSPLALTKDTPDAWIQCFDRAVRASLVAAVKECVAAYYRCNLESWLRQWCGQVTVLALRILHTEGLRRALQLAGQNGLIAYITKVSDLCSAISKLAQRGYDKGVKGGQPRSYEAVVAAALAYEEFALREVQLAVEWHVSSVTELESTRVVQTFLTPAEDGICVRMMGVLFDYGLEFLGHASAPMMSAAQWVQMAPVLVDMELSRSVSLVSASDDIAAEGEVLEAAAMLLGRFFFRVEATEHVPTETLQRLLRGCVEVGALACVMNCEAVPRAVLEEAVLPIATASVEQRRSSVWQLPYGGKDDMVSVSVHPLFRLAFSAAAPVALPRSLDLICREVRVAPFDVQEALHDYLTRTGVVPAGPLSAEEAEFAKLYRQLQELHPTVFTARQLRVVLREAFASVDARDGRGPTVIGSSQQRVVTRLLTALGSVFTAFFSTDGEAVQRSLETQIKAKLLLPSCHGVAPPGWYDPPVQRTTQTAAADALLERFTSWMNVHRRVLLVGPPFAGKTRLWRTWAGSQSPLIVSLSLISAADFYGTSTEPSFLSLITSHMTAARHRSKAPVVVMEDVGSASSFALFLGSWPDRARVLEGELHNSNSVIPSPLVRVIGTAQGLHHVTPGTLNRFAMMALAGPSSWHEGISHALGSMPDAEWVARVLEKLLPPLVERASRASPELVGRAKELTNMYAVAQRAAALCSRWYAYALTLHTHRGALELEEEEDEVPLRLFAVRCAVMAATWSVGLSLPMGDRDILKLSLLGAETDVMKALADCELSGEIFPVLSKDSVSPLEQVVLPRGWISFEEAATRTDLPLSWSADTHTDPHLCAWSQVFLTPSRAAILRATECLINCGQHVLFHAGPVAGKSTLLHTMKANEVDWVVQVYNASGGMQPIHIQQRMASELVQRSDGRHSPTLGRRLVVCIDDLHLAPVVARNGDDEAHTAAMTLGGCLIRFCDKFRAISTPRTGTMPLANVVFCGSSLFQAGSGSQCSTGALSGCVDVRLPGFDSDEIACGVHLLCNLASSRKRTKEFSQGCATFLGLVHGAYTHLRLRVAALAPCPMVAVTHTAFTPASSISAVLSTPLNTTNVDASASRQGSIPSFYAEYLRDALQAAEVVRLHLISNASDVQVATRVFLDVTAFYEAQLRAPPSPKVTQCSESLPLSPPPPTVGVGLEANDALRALHGSAVEAAESSMRECIRGSVNFADLVPQLPNLPEPDAIAAEDESFVADCIAEFASALQDEREEDLSTLEERRGPGGGANIKGVPTRAETRCASVFVSYPDFLRKAAVRSGGAHKGMLVRRSSSMAALSGNSSLRGSFAITPGCANGLSMAAAVFQQQKLRPSTHIVTTSTYQTTWLTTRLVFLQDTLSAPHAQVVFLGESAFGLRRLFRLWCANTHVPLMWFRMHSSASPAEANATFRHDLRSAITFACMNSIHAVIYLPPELLRMPEVLLIVDPLVRSGDVSGLFSDEERNSLMRGFRVTHPRSLKPFTLVDDTELRDRLRSSFNFVFHLRDAAEVKRIAAAYPFLRQHNTSVLRLYTEALRSSLVQELVLSVLRSSGGADVDGIPTLDSDDTEEGEDEGVKEGGRDGDDRPVSLSQRAVCRALCAIFAHVSERHPTSLTQLVEFVSLYRDLSSAARVEVLESARTGTVIMSRGDEAVQMVRTVSQRTRAIAEGLAAEQLRIASLSERLRDEENELTTQSLEAQALGDKLQETREALVLQRATLADALKKAEERLERAARQLRKAKVNNMRALAVSRVPDKGTLLVRCLYAVLGEDLPKHNDNPHELWSTAMKRVCTKEFTMTLTGIAPDEDRTALKTYLLLRQELDAVRYAPAQPYAQLLADFVVEWVDYGKFRAEDYATGVQDIEKSEDDLKEGEELYATRLKGVQSALGTVACTKAEIDAAQRSTEALQGEQRQLAGIEARLMKYTGLVDRFSRFLVAPADVAERAKFARCAAADTFLVSAFYSLLAMHDKAEDTYVSLQQLLVETVHPRLHSTAPQEAFAYMLYQTHAPRTRALMLPGSEHFAWEYRALFMALFKRVASRWTLIGAATPLIEQEVCKYLSLSCTGCVVMSMTDPSAKERLIAAMRAGEGVLLRDVHDPASLDLIRYLNPLYCKLKVHWNAELGPRRGSTIIATAQSPQALAMPSAPRHADEEDATARSVSLLLEGREVRVHPSFYMVCTSSLAVPVETNAVCDAINVYNLCTPMPQRLYYECLLRDAVCTTSVSTKMCNMREEITTQQQVYFRVLQEFVQVHDAAAKLLAADIGDIRDGLRGDTLVADANRALADVDMYEGQLSQTVYYVQSWQKAVHEGWGPVLPALEAVASFAELIEAERLQRPWSASALDRCLMDMVRFPPVFMRHFAPQSFSDLPAPLKRYYATVHYVQRVVEQLAAGWPVPVRGIFSLLLLASAMAAAPVVFAAKTDARVLTAEQTRVLQVLLREGLSCASLSTGKNEKDASISSLFSLLSSAGATEEELRRGMLELYTTSEDALLHRVARRGSTVPGEEKDLSNDTEADVDENQFYVAHFFSSMAKLQVEQANHYAASLYGTFMESVTRLEGTAGEPKPPAMPLAADGRTGKRWMRTSTDMPSQHIANETQESGMNSSRSDSGKDNAEEVELRDVISVGVQMERAAMAQQPLCLITDSGLTSSLSWLRHEAVEAKLDFVWQELNLCRATTAVYSAATVSPARSGARGATFVTATQTLISLTKQFRFSGKGRGVCLALVVDADVKEGVNEKDARIFREELQWLLSLYTNTFRPSGGGKVGAAVYLAVICSPATERVLWRGAAAGHVTPCCYIPLSTITPQQRLVQLLQPSRRYFTDRGVVQACETILQNVAAEMAHRSNINATHSPPPNNTMRVRGPTLAKLTIHQNVAQASMPLPTLPRFTSPAALTALQNAVENLLCCAHLVHHEMVVSHVVSTIRERMRCEGNKLGCYVDDPAPLVQLHDLLSEWVVRCYEALVANLSRSTAEEVQSPTNDRAAAAESTAKAEGAFSKASFNGDLVLPLALQSVLQRDAVERNALPYGLKAYYYLRRRQLGWQLLLERHFQATRQTSQEPTPVSSHASVERFTHAVLSIMTANSKMGDALPSRSSASRDSSLVDLQVPSAAELPLHLERSSQRSAQRSLVERAVKQWRTGLFAMARQFAFFFMSCRQRNDPLPAVERQAQWTMLRALIGTPEHGDEVSCLWGQNSDAYSAGEAWQTLMLDARYLDHFRLEVDIFPSDLMELCGEAAPARRLRRMQLDSLLHLCFPTRGSSTYESSKAAYKTLVDIPSTAPAIAAAEDLGRPAHTGDEPASNLASPAVPEEAESRCGESPLHLPAASSSSHRAVVADILQSFSMGLACHAPVTVGEPYTQVWLPSLRHPMLDLEFLTTIVHRPASSPSDSATEARVAHVTSRDDKPFADGLLEEGQQDGHYRCAGERDHNAVASRLILVVTQRRYLFPSDVILTGARLSLALVRQLAAQTQWSAGRDGDETTAGLTAAVVVVRRVLVRPRVQNVEGCWEREEASARIPTYEVGMWMWPTTSSWDTTHSSSQLRWYAVTCSRLPADALLWDTTVVCRPTATSVAHSSSTASEPLRRREGAADSTFVTEMQESAKTATPKQADLDAPRSWSVTEVPVPVRWHPLSGDSSRGVRGKGAIMLELYLCVEYEPLATQSYGFGSDASSSSPSSSSMTTATGACASCATRGAWDTLQLHETLDAYVWIE